MKRLRHKWIVYGMVLMLMALVPISATAGPTPNGQPFLEIWEELEDLQNQIDNQTADLSDLQAQLDAEVAARIAGDATLQAEIDAEEIARIAEDLALQAAINAEEAARIAADAALQAEIDALEAEDALDYDSLADLEAAMANGVNLAISSGNVGIGTTSPTEKLDVAGNIHASGSFIAGSTTTYGNGFIGLSPGTNLNVDSGTLFVDNADNQVGIGTTNPGYKLHVEETSGSWGTIYAKTSGGAYASIGISGVNYGTPGVGFMSSGGSFRNYGDSDGAKVGVQGFSQGIGGTNYGGYFRAINGVDNYGIYVDDGKSYFGGNVGIGTTSPSAELDVVGTVKATEFYDSTPVAFHAYNSGSDAYTTSGYKTVEFNTEEFDYGNNYDTTTDTFTAPTTGVYQFNTMVTGHYIDTGDWMGVFLIRNGVNDKRLETRNSGSSYQFQGISGSVTIKLNAGDDIQIRFLVSPDTSWSIWGGKEFTHFSGHRVA